jgi:hypothetical protein
MVGAVLAAIAFVPGSTPLVATATTAVVGTSSHALAYQHSAEDKVAYLHDGSLLVGYFDGSQVVIKHVTNPSTAPVSTTAETIAAGSEVTLYTLPGAGSTEIWIQVGNELYGGTLREQIQYGTYNGSTFSFGAVHPIPGALTNGRQDPTVTWTGQWLIASWWDDTLGGNSDSVFMNWTTDKTGASGWISKSGTTTSLLTGKNGTTGAPIVGTLTKTGTIAAAALNDLSVTYTLATGPAPAANDVFQFGTAGGTAEARQITTVTGTGPYTLTFTPGLSFAHVSGGDLSANTVTQVTYIAATNGAPVAGETYIFGASPALAVPEVRTVSIVSGTGPYTLTVPALNSSHAAAEVDTVQTWTIQYTVATGGAPLVNDMYQLGDGLNAEYRQLSNVTGTGPYVLTFAGLVNAHATSEVDTQEAAIQLTPVSSNIAQVSIRHSAKLGATIAVYGAHNRLFYRTLLDTATNPSLGNWTTESAVDSNLDDTEWGFGGPQVAIDETTGKIHVFRAVTNHGGPSYQGVNYWLGTPDATPMVSGSVNWNSRLLIDPAAGATDPPDVAGAVDSTGRVYVFWTTTAIAGAIKYVTLVSPYTAFTPAVTVPTVGANPRFPHVPAQAPLMGGVVPLVYQSGTSNPFSINLNDIYVPPAGTNSLGGTLTSGPDASSWGPSRTDVFLRGTDNGLWYRTWNGSSWGSWVSLGGILTADPSAVSSGPNRVDIFVRGTNNSLWHRSSDGTTWSDWENLGGGLTSGPDAASWAANQMNVFVRGTDKGLWMDSWNGATWTWTSLGGILTSDPGAVSSAANRVDVFVRGTDNALWQDSWNGTSWMWTSLGGGLTSGPDAASCTAGHLDVFVKGTDGGLWQIGFNGSSWNSWQSIGGTWTSDPGAVCPPGTTAIMLFERGVDNGLWQTTRPGS